MQVPPDQIRAGSGYRRRWVLVSSVILLGLVALAGSLLWSMPLPVAARLLGLPVEPARLSGTIRDGGVRLGGGHALTFRLAAWDSLRGAAPVVGWALTGPGTDLAGRLALPLPPDAARADLGPISGRVGWPLVALLRPDLGFRCDMAAAVADLRLALAPGARQAAGTISLPAGRCTPAEGAPAIPLPALAVALSQDAGTLTASVTRADAPGQPLATLRLTPQDRVVATVHPAGAALLPGLPATADTEIDLPLSALLP